MLFFSVPEFNFVLSECVFGIYRLLLYLLFYYVGLLLFLFVHTLVLDSVLSISYSNIH
jgi:hypothetical protein